jgi:SAM-dependent methyltransferase
MGLDINQAFLIARTATRWRMEGDVCTLGVVDQYFTPDSLATALRATGRNPINSVDPFLAMGFRSVASLDVNDFEGCLHIHDLNSPTTPAGLTNRFDVVFNGGTLEHVFDVSAGLRNIFQMLRHNGVVLHFAPINGWVDHGFYQISPTLFTDYYMANGYDILESCLIEFNSSYTSITVHPYSPGILDGLRAGYFPGVWMFFGAFRKTKSSRANVVPLQYRYACLYGEGNVTKENPPSPPLFVPFMVSDGKPHDLELEKYPIRNINPGQGNEWLAPLPDLKKLADGPNGGGSPLLLFQNGVLIGPAHTLHQDIRDFGRGRYSHWQGVLHFSTSDNASPDGRMFEVGIPAHLKRGKISSFFSKKLRVKKTT